MSYSRWQMGDPAKIVEAQEIRDKGCRVCARAMWVMGRPLCPEDLRFPRCRRDKKRGFKLIEVDE